MAKNNQIEVNGIDIKYKKINKADYISLTDIARYANPKEPKVPIQTWIRNKEIPEGTACSVVSPGMSINGDKEGCCVWKKWTCPPRDAENPEL